LSSISSPLFANSYTQKKAGGSQTLGNLFSQYGSNTALQNTTQGQRSSESGSLIPGYQSLIDSGGYSPTEKASIEQGTIGGITGSYAGAGDQAARQVARTGNSAGYGSLIGNLARNKARDVGQEELQVQSQFANEAYQRKLAGLQGLQQMYGVDTSFLNALGNQQQGLLGLKNRITTSQPGTMGNIMGGLQIAGGIAGTAAKFL
jgi:hypothetical protein